MSSASSASSSSPSSFVQTFFSPETIGQWLQQKQVQQTVKQLCKPVFEIFMEEMYPIFLLLAVFILLNFLLSLLIVCLILAHTLPSNTAAAITTTTTTLVSS